jgi:hypothetical protein
VLCQSMVERSLCFECNLNLKWPVVISSVHLVCLHFQTVLNTLTLCVLRVSELAGCGMTMSIKVHRLILFDGAV